MTLIASFLVESSPVLLGDLMIGQWEESPPPRRPFNIPTSDNVNALIPNEWGVTISQLRQKVVCVTDHLAIAWAGNEIAARAAIRELKHAARSRRLTGTRIGMVLNALDLGSLDLDLFCLLLRPHTGNAIQRVHWQYGAAEKNTAVQFPPLHDVHVAGSGARDFLNSAGAMAEALASAVASHRRRGPLAAASAACFLSGQQMRTGAGVQDRYGGGFEIATVDSRRVIKLGAVTYYFLEASQKQGNLQLTLQRALKIDYDDDLLLIRSLNTPMSLEISSDNVGVAHYDPTGFDLAMYVIYPPDRRPTESERIRYQSSDRLTGSFGSKICSFYIYLPERDLVMTLVHYSADSDLALQLRLEGEDLMLAFSPVLVGKLRAAVAA